ncbi:MAG: DUF2927 domain-containing protein [Pseudomonadota bacterium]
MADRDDRSPGTASRRRFLKDGALFSAAALVLPEVPAGLLSEQPEVSTASAVAFFDTLALTQVRRGTVRHTWVRKWGWPATVRLHGAISETFRDDVAAAIDDLTRLTGHELVLEGDGVTRVGTIDIIVSPHDEIDGQFPSPGAVCNTHTRGARGALYFARIDISEEYTDCLRHELMHAMGFANHWMSPAADTSMPSVLAMRNAPFRSEDYSEWDRLALRLLYHPDMQPGLPRGVALQKAEAMLIEALQDAT